MINDRLYMLNLYTASICNLNCVYCYLDKSSALKSIDDILEESFASDYYFDFSKKLYNQNKLTDISFWGGEPTLGLHRVYHLIPKFIDYYPNLNKFLMSTNFTTPNWFQEFYQFLKILEQYPERDFIFALQLSIDGPEYINDANRGKGVTKKFITNFYHLANTINENLPKNVILKVHFKPTYSNETISLLQDKEKIIEYFSFFDNLITDFKQITNNKKIMMLATIPNTAVPAAHSVADGKMFANYCKLTREIEKENRFKNYGIITTYAPRRTTLSKNKLYQYQCKCGTCGAGVNSIGLLPNNYISLCNSGFTGLLEEYKINSKINHENDEIDKTAVLKELFTNDSATFPLCVPEEEYDRIFNLLNSFYHMETTNQTVNVVALLKILAASGQIEKRFLDDEEALKAAHYYLTSISYCIRDNGHAAGMINSVPIGLLKLLFNGAYEYLIREAENKNV